MSFESELYFLLAMAVLGIPLGFALRRSYRRDNALMAEVARRRNATLIRRGGIDRVEVVSGSIRIAVWGSGGLRYTRLHWSAELPGPATVPFQIKPPAWPAGGETRPEEIETQDRQTLRRIWRAEEDAIMRRFFRGGVLTSTGYSLYLVLETEPTDVATVEAGIDLLLRVGSADAYGLAALRSLADAQEGPWRGGLPSVVIDGAVPVWVGVERIDGRARTRAHTQGIESMPPGRVEVMEGQPVEPDARLPEAAAMRLDALGSVTVSWDAETTWVEWAGIQDDTKRLAAAVAFLRAMIAPHSMGVFR